MPKSGDNGRDTWFDNVVTITRVKDATGKPIDKQASLDIYEYYWANYTQDKASLKDINKWVNGVVEGSGSFYSTKKNAELGKQYSDKSVLFREDGSLNVGMYRLLLFFIRVILPVCQFFMRLVLRLVSKLPFVGSAAEDLLDDFVEQKENDFSNIIGDIVVYNVTDPKCKYYDVRRKILDGAVSALKYLFEKTTEGSDKADDRFYKKVYVAGHSLGTEIGYDAINKLNLLVNEGLIKGYDNMGKYTGAGSAVKGTPISGQLGGFITFGSPLDKIAFFLREIVPNEQYLRQQILDHYHGFMQRDWTGPNNNHCYVKLENKVGSRHFDEIKWVNYYDKHDYVSGALDYYNPLENVNCHFDAGRFSFTHSYYWDDDRFFIDIIANFF